MSSFMALTQGEITIRVNIDQVTHITPNVPKGSVLYFGFMIEDTPAYLIVNESPDEIMRKLV